MNFPRTYRILVVEDELLIAMMLADALEDLGCEVVGPANRLGEAIELASSPRLDGALVDLNLRGEGVWPLVDLLLARGVPLVLCTGYDPAGSIPDRYAGPPLLAKPFDADELKVVVADAILGPAAAGRADSA